MTLSDREQEAYSRGLAAASLLTSPDFIEVIRSLMLESYAVFTETGPSEGSARDDTYNLVRGLKAIEAELNARVQVKDEIERRVNADDQHPDDLNDEDAGPINITGD